MIGNSLEQGSAFCQALDSKHFGLCEPQGHNYSTLQMQPQTECMYVNKQVQEGEGGKIWENGIETCKYHVNMG